MQTEKIDLVKALPVIRSVISTGGVFRIFPYGASMLPTIREGRDTVCLAAPDGLCRGDIVLYERADGAMILHRIVKIKENGFDICGDNQISAEKNVDKNSIIAVVSEYTNGEKTVKRGGVRFIAQYFAVLIIRPFRRVCLHLRYRMKKLILSAKEK